MSVKATDTAMTAFNLKVDKDIVGVGVIDDAGRLVGNVSTRDLRAIRLEHEFVVETQYVKRRK